MYSIMKKSDLMLLSVFVCFCFGGCIKEQKDISIKPDSERILENAGKFLNSEGISTENTTVFFDKGNIEWLKQLEYLKKNDACPKRLDVLSNSEYQAVRFAPKEESTVGGIYWVFVDKQSKKVITFLGFK